MLKQSSGGFNISLSERWAQIESGRFHLNIRLIDGAYPNFHSVIPVYRKENVIEVDKLELMRAIRLVSIGANQATGLLKLEAHSDYKSLTITGKDDDWVTRSSAEISTKDADAVDALCRVGLKGVFLTKTLKMITTQKVRLHIADKTRCILVKPEDDRGYLTLLMPMILTD
jgi:DNA polymerase-3 subunit beta